MKKLTALFLAVAIIIVSGFAASANNKTNTTSANADSTAVLGDVDLDSRLTIKDATLIQKYVADITVISEASLLNGDVNKDSRVNVLDATAIQKEIANIRNELTNPTVPHVTEETESTAQTMVETTVASSNEDEGYNDVTEIVTENTVATTTQATLPTEPTVPATASTEPDIEQAKNGVTEMELEVWRILNAEREKAGLHPLGFNYALHEAARVRATEAATTFSHIRPDGTSFSTVFAQFNMRIDNIYYGENLARYFTTPEMAIRGLMNSDGHRENMLHSELDYVAIGIVEIPHKPGFYSLAQLFTSDPVF